MANRRFNTRLGDNSLLLPLLVALIVIGAGALVVIDSYLNELARANAELRARSWSKVIVDTMPGLEKILAGHADEALADHLVADIAASAGVFCFKLFDAEGNLRYDSRTPDATQTLSDHNPKAASVIVSGDSFFNLETRKPDAPADIPQTYSEVYVPLTMDGRFIGVVEVYSAETGFIATAQDLLGSAALRVTALVLAAFVVPGLLYVYRTRQLNLTARQLRHTVEYDELTGTLNRATFARDLHAAIAEAQRKGQELAVHFVDLDRFKDVNDTRGHAFGDAVLRIATDRIQHLLNAGESIGRQGGDEFAICQPFPQGDRARVFNLANAIAGALSEPIQVGNDKVQIGASIGFAFLGTDGNTADELLRMADIALYKAKESARGKALAFRPEMEAERRRRQAIETRLRLGLSQSLFELDFQPLVDAHSGDLRGFEALLRLTDEAGAPIPPDVFVPIAEDIGLISEIGAWVLQTACAFATAWPKPLCVSVNLSPAQFLRGDMAEMVAAALASTGLAANRLELEVTESLLISETDTVLAQLTAIKALGVSIALDDFGTGYSSLSYLWQFPFDTLKVDKSFMHELSDKDSKSRDILATIVALSRVLDLKVTAEGVETEEQARAVRDLDCDLVQGYYYGRPMKAVDLAARVLADVGKQLGTPVKTGEAPRQSA